MDLVTPLDTICRLIVRAREYEAQVPSADPENDDEPIDADDDLDVLEDETNEAVEEELRGLLDELADDQVAEVLALAWVGRGTYDATEWDDALEEANDVPEPVEEILELPMLSGYLEAGLAAFDMSCEGVGQID